MNPSIGRIVHYVESGTTEHRAALIIEIAAPRFLSDPERIVYLRVFSRAGDYTVAARRGDDGREGSWHWPEREGQS